jgi:hypothetical protein
MVNSAQYQLYYYYYYYKLEYSNDHEIDDQAIDVIDYS